MNTELLQKIAKERGLLEDVGVDGMRTYEFILKKQDGRA
jgi:hypothetical protein